MAKSERKRERTKERNKQYPKNQRTITYVERSQSGGKNKGKI